MGFEPSEIDLGSAPWFSELSFEAQFFNGSSEPVRVAAVQSSCGCTVVDYPRYADQQVDPGSSLNIAGTLDVGERLGRHRMVIELMLDSGIVRVLGLGFDGVATYHVSPTKLDFGTVDLDAIEDEPTQVVLFASDVTAIVARPSTDVPWLRVGYFDRGTGETEIAVGIERTNLSHGNNTGHVIIPTDDATRPTFKVAVRARGVARLRPVPSHVFVPCGATQKVRFISEAGEDAEIVKIACDHPAINAYIENGGVVVSARAGMPVSDEAIALYAESNEGQRSRVLVSVMD